MMSHHPSLPILSKFVHFAQPLFLYMLMEHCEDDLYYSEWANSEVQTVFVVGVFYKFLLGMASTPKLLLHPPFLFISTPLPQLS